MNKVFAFFRRGMVPVLGILAAGVLFSACLKDKDNDYNNIPAAGLMAFNLAPDQHAVGIALTGNSLTNSGLNYTSYTGAYYPIYVGNRTVEAYTYGNQSLASATFNFEQDKYYSVFVVGVDSTYRNVIVEDNMDSLPVLANTAYVRYINAIPNSSDPNVKVSAGGSDVVNESAGFSTVSAFKAVTPGSITIAVSNGGNVQTNRTITVEGKKVYTVLLVGLPGETDDILKPQIKFVTNGILTEDETKK
jgi:hypothetical protein